MVENVNKPQPTTTAHTNQATVVPCGAGIGKSSFHLSSRMSFLGQVTEEDDLSRYLSNAVSKADRELLQSNDGIVV